MIPTPDRLAAALADRYRIERELGQGGMAKVYLAEDLKHDRKVALKVLKPELAAVLGAERFVVEIKTTAALQHPHILPLFDSGSVDGFLYYVMPFIDGETLRSRLDRETQLGIDESVRITIAVADALHYAHRHGVIHRDIKPENILLHDGRPMVADFGIALALSAAAGGRMTETGMSLGTPHYMSPEQATADKEITARSDLYSLASVLYEMLAGNPPHTGSSAQQIIMKIVTGEPPPVTGLRKSVPQHIAAAIAKALEKVPADRFDDAKAFAEALTDTHFTTARMTAAHGELAVSRSWLRDPRTIAALAALACLLVALAVTSLRRGTAAGPTSYDVGLPAGAALTPSRRVGFAVAPAGDFLIYEAVTEGGPALWYRSLRDASTRRIDGTEGGRGPSISPDGERVAFERGKGDEWTIEIVPVAGGPVTTVGRGSGDTWLRWLTDGRLQVIDADGTRAPWFDPGGGTPTTTPLRYCIMAAPLADPTALLCGGGGVKYAYRTDIRDSSISRSLWRVGDSTEIIGTHFRLVDERYLVYLSVGGDLLAAPVDLESGGVGRSVRLVTGLGRREYTGAGTYDLSRSGTLVYAPGINQPVGHLVVASDSGLDTLPVGREAFLRFSMSPDGRRIAAVVEGIEGEELRIYDRQTGRHVVWVRRLEVRQPVWSPRGDRILFSSRDSVFIGSPDRATAPESVMRIDDDFEGFSWMSDDHVVGILWTSFLAAMIDVGGTPATLDTLFPNASFVRTSPDGRWIAYSDRGITEIWLEPFPRDGRRYQVASGGIDEAQWLSSSELAISMYGPAGDRIERVALVPAAEPPLGPRRAWLQLPEFRGTAGQSFAVTPYGILYVQGAVDAPAPYLRVVPGWVNAMKRSVDAANR